jgi:hypothetical protein
VNKIGKSQSAITSNISEKPDNKQAENYKKELGNALHRAAHSIKNIGIKVCANAGFVGHKGEQLSRFQWRMIPQGMGYLGLVAKSMLPVTGQAELDKGRGNKH